MNLSIMIREGLEGSDSEKCQRGSKKYANNSAFYKTKLKKENSSKRKIKAVTKKYKNFNRILTDTTSITSSDKKGNKLRVLERFISQTNHKDSYGEKSYGNKFGLLSHLFSKGTLRRGSSKGSLHSGNLKGSLHSGSLKEKPRNGNSRHSTKKNLHGNARGSKLIKADRKLITPTEEKKKSYLINIPKNTPAKKNRNYYLPNLSNPIINAGKNNYKLSKLLTPSEKFGKKKKNKITKHFLGLKKGMNMMNGTNGKRKDDTGSGNSQNGRSNHQMGTKNEQPLGKTDSNDNVHEENGLHNDMQNDGSNSVGALASSLDKAQHRDELDNGENMNNMQKGYRKNGKSYEKMSKKAPGHVKEELFTAAPRDPYFTTGVYDASNDVLKEEMSYYDAQQVSASLLPGYKEVTFDGIGENRKINLYATGLNKLQINSMYCPNRFYEPYNYISHRSKAGPNEAYHLKNLNILNNYLFTSTDLSQGTIHKQSNIGVTYPYGVPFINIKKCRKT
ncbi:hypothetical protein PGO_041120 [Plasmodium gonderi]|uniref:Uncharacterized protein n=1 Tax=Plasmodium gonderi TaxID=77519 RepID=A0A1Y1JFI6_PLAGO|nr:hypothetical protein PGO_041120 [Plasmodium gonderi]GAW79512.1 hypothetical protein PGO_041120 [Plasmodium gonderi]